jgi:hypothetical protein
MSMFGSIDGAWGVSSKTDPRWNKSGEAPILVCSGWPQALRDWVEECRAKYGEMPEDLKGWQHKY